MAIECSLPCSISLISISARLEISSLLYLLFLLLFAFVKCVGVFARPISPLVYLAVITVLSHFSKLAIFLLEAFGWLEDLTAS